MGVSQPCECTNEELISLSRTITLRNDGSRAAMPLVEPEIGAPMDVVLWIIAVILVISGIVTLFRGQVLLGIVLIVVGLLVGPGGVSVFT